MSLHYGRMVMKIFYGIFYHQFRPRRQAHGPVLINSRDPEDSVRIQRGRGFETPGIRPGRV